MMLPMSCPHPSYEIICNQCKLSKQCEEFYKHPYSPNRHRNPCKECLKINRRNAYVRLDGYNKSYAQLLHDRYGITLDEYNRMFEEQKGRCAICDRPEIATTKSGKARRLAIDHDHATGAIRSLLCIKCNASIAALESGHASPQDFAVYIDKHRETFSRLKESEHALSGLEMTGAVRLYQSTSVPAEAEAVQ